MKKTIVVSAVNLVEAGTLAILRNCLECLSSINKDNEYRIVAIVFDKNLADYPNIEYIETKWPKKRWINRLWYEYVSLKKVSKDLSPVYLWLSLHDTTPTVVANHRAVYCHNSFSFYKWKMKDWLFAPKIAMFAVFTKYIYKTNIQKNDYLIVQQEWFRKAMAKMFSFDENKIIVAPPNTNDLKGKNIRNISKTESNYNFVYAASPNSHKNFECICEAVAILKDKYNIENFSVSLTIKGTENKYTNWILKKWGSKYRNIEFVGFVSKDKLLNLYESSDCLIFPSKVETWGLPISEFADYQKPMLLADLPYAHETACGADYVAFFDPFNPLELVEKMRKLIKGDTSILCPVPKIEYHLPYVKSWKELFQFLLAES